MKEIWIRVRIRTRICEVVIGGRFLEFEKEWRRRIELKHLDDKEIFILFFFWVDAKAEEGEEKGLFDEKKKLLYLFYY